MLEILKSPNGAIIAMEKVYSKLENRNFYKQNIGKDNISYLDSNLDIQIYKEKDYTVEYIKGFLEMFVNDHEIFIATPINEDEEKIFLLGRVYAITRSKVTSKIKSSINC